MAPIRRYLRITKYSVLEVRVYLDNPALSETWLLRRGDPALPRIIDAVQPLVLPKLREENERAKGKGRGKSKKGVKDVVSRDDFEVSIFLTSTTTPHTLLTKQKHFGDKPRLKSNSAKLTGWLTTGTAEKPIDVPEGAEQVPIIRAEEDDEPIDLDNIPDAPPPPTEQNQASQRRSKRRREGSEEDLFVGDDDEDDEDESYDPDDAIPTRRTRRKRRREDNPNHSDPDPDLDPEPDEQSQDEKKKMAMRTEYDGFSIYGKILCLVVKRTGTKATTGGGAGAAASGQQMMEAWVSTQAVQDDALDMDEDG
ncbi:hypothetical protein K402DRAFT_460358 [Aulographum hederae CBS 113979]|uniref:Uncharacterized protein n=1 Tax=Aulographum hederae CBS 113979 TaxID=1176131 RepID=A0A6G1HAQ9_9PEZI|nr:hypothetical protein K402DRAFT_460358 [Aulographum hederae CBS 113979]